MFHVLKNKTKYSGQIKFTLINNDLNKDIFFYLFHFPLCSSSDFLFDLSIWK